MSRNASCADEWGTQMTLAERAKWNALSDEEQFKATKDVRQCVFEHLIAGYENKLEEQR